MYEHVRTTDVDFYAKESPKRADPGIQDYLTGPHVYSRWPDALFNASEYKFASPCDCFAGSGKFPNLIYTRSGSTFIAIQ